MRTLSTWNSIILIQTGVKNFSLIIILLFPGFIYSQVQPNQVGFPPNNSDLWLLGIDTFPSSQTYGFGKWYDFATILDSLTQGSTDHGELSGLADDDHLHYALLAGRTGGQILKGGTGITDDLTLQTTSGAGATGADMHFKVGNNGATEAMTILNNGNIGINVSSPSVSMQIKSLTVGDADLNVFELYNSDNDLRTSINGLGAQKWVLNNLLSEVGNIQYTTPGGQPGIVFFNNTNTGRSQIKQLSSTGGIALGATTTGSNPSDQFILNTSGNVAIGASSPSARLHLLSTAEQFRSGFNTSNYWNATTASNGLTTINAVGTGAAFLMVDNVGIGNLIPAARLHVQSVTEQLRVGYDSGSYYSTTVGTTGSASFDAVGLNAGFLFVDKLGYSTNGGTPTSLTGRDGTYFSDITLHPSLNLSGGVLSVTNTGTSDHDWYESGNTPPNSINDEMYHLGDTHFGDATMSGQGLLNAGTSGQFQVAGTGSTTWNVAGTAITANASPVSSSGPNYGFNFNLNTDGLTDNSGWNGIKLDVNGSDLNTGSSYFLQIAKNNTDFYSLDRRGEINWKPLSNSGWSSFNYDGLNATSGSGFFRGSNSQGGIVMRNALVTDDGTGVGFRFAVTTNTPYTPVTNLNSKVLVVGNGMAPSGNHTDVFSVTAGGNGLFTGKLGYNTEGSIASTLAGRDASENFTDVGTGWGVNLIGGEIIADTSQLATQYDLTQLGGATAISSLTPAQITNTIDNQNYLQEWKWSTLTGGTGLKLSSNSTAAINSSQKLFEVSLSGSNSVAGQSTTAGYFSNNHSGTNATNIGIHSSITGNGYAVYGDGGSSNGVFGSTSVGTGVFGSASGNGNAVYGSSTSGFGLFGNTSQGIALVGNDNGASTNTARSVLSLRRFSSGTAANGIGASIEFLVESAGGGAFPSNFIHSKWTDVTDATRTSQLIFNGINSAAYNDILALNGNGSVQLFDYGLGNFTGTAAYCLAVDASGNLIEQACDGGGGGSEDHDWYEEGTTTPPNAITDNIYKTTGSVGIGSVTPGAKVEIKSDGSDYSTKALILKNSNNIALQSLTSDGRAYIGVDNGANSLLTLNRSSGNSIANLVELTNADGLDLSLFSGSTYFNNSIQGSSGKIAWGNTGVQNEQMVLNTANGRLGIGVDDPQTALHVLVPGLAQARIQSTVGQANLDLVGTSFGQITNEVGTFYISNVANNGDMVLRTDNSTEKLRISPLNATFVDDVIVPDETYSSGWDGSLEVPTKNSLFDKIETLDANGANEIQTLSASGTTDTYGINLSLGGGTVNLIEGTGITIDRTSNNLTISGSSGSSDHDWYEEGTTTAPNAITDNMFTQASELGIGTTTPDFQVDIESNTANVMINDLNGGTGNQLMIKSTVSNGIGQYGGISLQYLDEAAVDAWDIEGNRRTNDKVHSTVTIKSNEAATTEFMYMEKNEDLSNNTHEAVTTFNSGMRYSQYWESTTSNALTLDRGYYNVVLLSGHTGTITLPEVETLTENYTTINIVKVGVGQEYVISNFSGSPVTIAAFNPGGSANDDYLDGIEGGTFSLANNDSVIIKAVTLISSEGRWFTYN